MSRLRITLITVERCTTKKFTCLLIQAKGFTATNPIQGLVDLGEMIRSFAQSKRPSDGAELQAIMESPESGRFAAFSSSPYPVTPTQTNNLSGQTMDLIET